MFVPLEDSTNSNIVAATHILGLLTNAGVLIGIGLLLNQHKIWIRLKERVNMMYREYCYRKEIPYTSLEGNGHKGE